MQAIALLVLLLLGVAASAGQPRVAIIIDDLGHDLELGRAAVELPAPLTYSVLPMRPYSHTLARLAHANGKEVMLHLPMQATGGQLLGPGGLHEDMGRGHLAAVLREGLAGVPHVAGVNNHMGSYLTRRAEPMRWVMRELRCAGELYFVDSRTDVRTIARRQARAAGLANGQRDVFLDNLPDPDYVRGQLRKLVARARQRGYAIAIGHPRPVTLAVLTEQLPLLAAAGIDVVPVSRIVEQRRNPPPWLVCSSPLQTAAKKSRPSPSSTCCDAPASRSLPPG
jgi:polysaccharide deacetylase 2 family uncharacterized protein YibQ